MRGDIEQALSLRDVGAHSPESLEDGDSPHMLQPEGGASSCPFKDDPSIEWITELEQVFRTWKSKRPAEEAFSQMRIFLGSTAFKSTLVSALDGRKARLLAAQRASHPSSPEHGELGEASQGSRRNQSLEELLKQYGSKVNEAVEHAEVARIHVADTLLAHNESRVQAYLDVRCVLRTGLCLRSTCFFSGPAPPL